MALYNKNGRLTFGFTNVNNGTIKVKITESSRARFIDKLTLPFLRGHIVKVMNKHGKRAERIAKMPGHSPHLTGKLARSIKWQRAKRGGLTGITIGQLTVGVIYGRVQELSPTQPRRLYLKRALDAVAAGFASDLSNKRVLENIILGKRRAVNAGLKNQGNFNG